MLFIASLLIKFMHVTHPTRFFIFSFLLKRVMTRGKCQDQNVYRYFFFFILTIGQTIIFLFLTRFISDVQAFVCCLCVFSLRIHHRLWRPNWIFYYICFVILIRVDGVRKHILNGKSSSWHEWILKKISCNILYCEFVTRKFLKFQYRIFEFFK